MTGTRRAELTEEAGRSWRGYARAAGMVLLATAVAFALRSRLQAVDAAMLLLLGVVAAASWTRLGPALVAAVVSIAAFDFLFVPPFYTFGVRNTAYLLTFVVMLVVAVTMSRLTTRVRQEADEARARERRTARAFALSRELADTPEDQLVAAALAHMRAVTGIEPLLVSASGVSVLEGIAERVAVGWAIEHGEPAGSGTARCAEAEALVIPVRTAASRHGVVLLPVTDKDDVPGDEQRLTLEALADQLALALERAALAGARDLARVEIEAERLRTALLSSLSHDLRTPLAGIEGAATSLLQGADTLPPAVRRELADGIVEESRRMTRLVTNLLDMVRVEAGALAVQKEWQPLEEALGVALLRLEDRLAAHPVETRLPDDLPLVPIDGLLIEQVFINLLENVVKYTPPGTPVTISAETAGEGVVVSVSDRGPGIPAGSEQEVFRKFYRGRGVGAGGAEGGSGLGLTICRGIVQAHGGRIWAERCDDGVTFRFLLPIGGLPMPPVPVEAGS
ncbi:MAG TPA: DUF4118 domain-containing protein [Gemmatimonadales bacterium]|nr:DUF4118 domain-containing protein [Gemmatimonadales bacterium]